MIVLLLDPQHTKSSAAAVGQKLSPLPVCLHQVPCSGRQKHLVSVGWTGLPLGAAAEGTALKTLEDTSRNRRSSGSQRRRRAAQRRPETGGCCSLQQGAAKPCGAEE